MNDISMTRGDTKEERFQIKDSSGTVLDLEVNEMYITFKESYDDEEFLFQKKLSTGDITKSSTYYYFTIEPEETDDLDYGVYVFDIEIIYSNKKKTIGKGNLTLTQEVTWATNEGES